MASWQNKLKHSHMHFYVEKQADQAKAMLGFQSAITDSSSISASDFT